MLTGGQQGQSEAGADDSQAHPSLQSIQLAPEPIVQPVVPTLNLDDACLPPGKAMSHPGMTDSLDILDTWEDTMFGPVGAEKAAATDSKKRPSSLLNTGMGPPAIFSSTSLVPC